MQGLVTIFPTPIEMQIGQVVLMMGRAPVVEISSLVVD